MSGATKAKMVNRLAADAAVAVLGREVHRSVRKGQIIRKGPAAQSGEMQTFDTRESFLDEGSAVFDSRTRRFYRAIARWAVGLGARPKEVGS